MSLHDVTISVRVMDPRALWEAAATYLRSIGYAADDDLEDALGPRNNPNVGGCLIMVLDRSEHLEGAEIENSSADEIEE